VAKAFRTNEEFRAWLEKNCGSVKELNLRLFKTHAKHRGMGYREALDEALCFGWIDGVRRSLDDDSFTQRFTPRKPKSNWSRVNIKRAQELEAEGRMRPAGLTAFRARDAIAVAPYSFENRSITLDAAAEKKFRANKRAWAFFQTRAPGYRRIAIFWVMSAKREETRARRLATLIGRCEKGEPIGQLTSPAKPK
jgi:uncharacterized protein YdeI (YjbR/CyaY-like superfamily)